MNKHVPRLLTVLFLLALVPVGPVMGQSAPDDPAPECQSLDQYDSTAQYKQCLVNHTTKQEVLSLVDTNPANLSQKQIDAVYAVYPSHADEYGFSTAEERRITAWMTWEKTGTKPDLAASNTSTAAPPTRNAELDIQQPHYVEEPVRVQTTDDTTVYAVQGPVQRIVPVNFDPDDVVGVTVKQENTSADIRFDERREQWTLDTNGQSGTYTVIWRVEESVASSNASATQTVRYEAQIRVSTSSLVHVSEDKYKTAQEDAKKWQEHVLEPLEDVVSDEQQIIEKHLPRGIAWIKFTLNPTTALTGTFLVLLTTLMMTPGGWFFSTIIFGGPILVVRWALKKKQEAEEKLGEVEDILRAQAEIRQEKAEQLINQVDVTDATDIPHRVAAPLREAFGRSVGAIAMRLGLAVTPESIKKMHLGPAIETGEYVIDYLEDGDEIVDADVHRDRDAPPTPEGYTRDDLGDAPPEAYGALDIADLPTEPIRRGVEVHELPHVPGGEHATVREVMDDMIDKHGVDIETQFNNDPERYGRAVADTLDYVMSTDYSTADNAVDPTRYAMNALHELLSVASDQFDAQYLSRLRDTVLYAAEQQSAAKRFEQTVEDTKQSGISTGTTPPTDRDIGWDYDPTLDDADTGGDQDA